MTPVPSYYLLQRFKGIIYGVCLIFFLFIENAALAQYTRHVVQLTDKGGSTYSLSRPQEFLSDKSIDRRQRSGIGFDSTDLPISPAYLSAIAEVPGVTVLNVSKWLNTVVIRISSPEALEQINTFPFVQQIRETAARALPVQDDLLPSRIPVTYELPRHEIRSGIRGTKGIQNEIDYGNTYAQIHVHEGEYLHNAGFTGSGLTIALLDAGYAGYLSNPAFDSLRINNRILGGYDFVQNTPGISQAHTHGTSCLSVIASNRPGVLVGSAPAASYWLLRTEDAASEYPIEEYNWAAAAEFADSVGADIISSSLGYITFDDPTMNYSYSMRDGNTGISTRAADLAARKGILVMNSAGNTGGIAGDERFISCPADGDSVVAVGAIRTDMQIAGFSSWGPNANGKVKPNLVSIGQGTILANAQGNPVGGNGTSFSNPNLAGLFACLWQAFPEFSNMDIINAVQQSADRYQTPEIRYGYGVPNFRVAYDALQQKRLEQQLNSLVEADWIRTFPTPFSTNFNVVFKARVTGRITLQLFDNLGRMHASLQMETIKDQVYLAPQFSALPASKGIYYILFSDALGKKTLKTIRL